MKLKFYTFLICLFTLLSASAKKVTDIDFDIDSSNFGVSNSYSLKIYLINKKGKRNLLSPGEFSLKWNKIKVTGDHILSFRHGIVVFNQPDIQASNNNCTIEVSYDNVHYMKKTFKLPYVKGMIINTNSILVNKYQVFDYQLVFNNGKTSSPSESLFYRSNIVSLCPSEVDFNGDKVQVKLFDVVAYETLKLKFKNKQNEQVLGEKTILLEYPTTSGANGQNGQNGANGKTVSEVGKSGSNGSNGTNASKVLVFVKSKIVNGTTFYVLHYFLSDGTKSTFHFVYLIER